MTRGRCREGPARARPSGGRQRLHPGGEPRSSRVCLKSLEGGAGPRVELGCRMRTVLQLAQNFGGHLWAHFFREGGLV